MELKKLCFLSISLLFWICFISCYSIMGDESTGTHSNTKSKSGNICAEGLNVTSQSAFHWSFTSIQKSLENFPVHPYYQESLWLLQGFLQQSSDHHQDIDDYLQVAFLLYTKPSQLLKINSLFRKPKLSLGTRTALPKSDIRNIRRIINEGLREQIREFQMDFARDMAEDKDFRQGNISPISLRSLAQIMQVKPSNFKTYFFEILVLYPLSHN